MGSTAIQLVTEAYRRHNLDEVTSFSTSLEHPYNLAKDVLNQVIREINRTGSFWFMETATSLPYSVGVYQYTLSSYGINEKKILRIRREASNYWGKLKQVKWDDFQTLYRSSAMTSGQPTVCSKFGGVLELNVVPDQDYSLKVSHYKDMDIISATTDTLSMPEDSEDIVIEGCYQYLGYLIGRWDLAAALGGIQAKVKPFLVDINQDAGIPTQMPAAF